MVKGISAITNLGKRGLMATLLAGSMTLGAGAAKLNNQNANTTTPTELVSKDAAAAMRANAISPQTTTQAVPTTHNIKLDNTLRKFIESEEDKEYIEDKIKTTYEKYGLFLGSALIQHEIDMQQLYALLTANTKVQIKNNINPEFAKEIEKIGPEFFKSITEHKDAAESWAFDKYSPLMRGLLIDFDHKPTADEVDSKLSEIINKYSGFDREEVMDYVVYTDNFNYHRLREEKDNQSLADLTAYKMHVLDLLIMEKQLYGTGIYRGAYHDGKKHLSEYVEKWLDSVAPKGKY